MTHRYKLPRAVFSRIPGFRNSPPVIRDAFLKILDTVFFASMMAEEGEFVPIGVVVELDEQLEEVRDSEPITDPYDDNKAWFVWRINALSFNPHKLKKLAHGTEYGRDLVIVTKRKSGLVMTGIARRRSFTDGGKIVRIAAPRPGVLILEGMNRQLGGVRYEAGVGRPNDIEVFEQEGPVIEALRLCRLEDHRWRLAETLRHARASRAGAMFLCLPTRGASKPYGKVGYRFANPSALERLAAQERALVFRGLASAHVDGHLDPEDVEEHAVIKQERATNQANLVATVEMLGRLAANDGAVVIEPGFQVVGAGFIISDMKGKGAKKPHPEPKECHDAIGKITIKRARSSGARHAAGYRFAWAVQGAVVFIVSSDGPVTCVLRRGDELLTWSVRLAET